MELATAFIWTLRILLPVILFCIYFKLQSKDEQDTKGKYRSQGPTYSIKQLTAARQAHVGCEVPEALEQLSVVDKSQAPQLFEGGRGRQRGGEGGRPRERREDRGSRRARKEETREPEIPVDLDAGESIEVQQDAPAFEPAQEKQHMESLLNYVAFNHREQRRVFLPDEIGAPPPPPPPRKAEEVALESDVEKANSEAQMVLRGAMKLERADVVSVLHDKLSEQHVEVPISASTYTLMIETCLLAKDLKLASDFLLKMENATYNPDSDLLDRVMNLYTEQKAKNEKAKEAQTLAASQAPVDGFSILFPPIEEIPDGVMPVHLRAKLSSHAAEFVPSFAESKLSSKAPLFVPVGPSATDEVSKDDAAKDGTKTALKASSKPFEPQFDLSAVSNPGYWQDPYGWPVDMPDAAYTEWDTQNGTSKKGKGKGAQEKNGGAKGKSKGKSKDAANIEDKAAAKTKAKAKPKAKAKEKSEGAQKGSDKKVSEKDSGNAKSKWKVKEAV